MSIFPSVTHKLSFEGLVSPCHLSFSSPNEIPLIPQAVPPNPATSTSPLTAPFSVSETLSVDSDIIGLTPCGLYTKFCTSPLKASSCGRGPCFAHPPRTLRLGTRHGALTECFLVIGE